MSNGETGLLVAAEDAEALQRSLALLIDDESLRTRMAAAGRERMQKEFSIDTMADRHITLYESVLNG